MKKLMEIGYTGYVGQEFIPTREPAGRAEAGRETLRCVSV